jgi:transposase-like protein
MTEKALEGMRLEIATTALGLSKPELVCPHCGKPVRLVLPSEDVAGEKQKASVTTWRAKGARP